MTSKFDGNSLSLQCKDRGGGGLPILSFPAKKATSNQTNDLKTLVPMSTHPEQFSETTFYPILKSILKGGQNDFS